MRRHDNRDRSRGSHGGFDCWDKMGDDYIDAKPDQLFSKLLGAIAAPLGIAELDLDVLAFRIAEGVQTAPESVSKWMWRRRRHQHANMGQLSGLLSARREWPHGRRAAEERDELAPFHCLPHGRRVTSNSAFNSGHQTRKGLRAKWGALRQCALRKASDAYDCCGSSTD